jgi:hypothetical protein
MLVLLDNSHLGGCKVEFDILATRALGIQHIMSLTAEPWGVKFLENRPSIAHPHLCNRKYVRCKVELDLPTT